MRGEVWDLNFDPTIGHEQAGGQTALILPRIYSNAGPAAGFVAVPITKKRTGRKGTMFM